jgi:two-component system response regulator FlrC
VRELENIIQRAMVLCPDNHIGVEHLMFDDAPAPFAMPEASAWMQDLPQASAASPLQATVKHSEHHAIRAALEASRSREEAAQKLGISPRTLRYKLARLRDAAPALAAHS